MMCPWMIEGVCRSDGASGDHRDGHDTCGDFGAGAAAGEQRRGAFPDAALHEREAVLQVPEAEV